MLAYPAVYTSFPDDWRLWHCGFDERKGIVRYGLHSESEAMMTYIVPPIMDDTHMHFIEGAAGGDTKAALGTIGP